MYELADYELDAVAAGQNPNVQVGNLVAANVVVGDVLSDNTVILENVLSGNTTQVAVGVAVALLSGATGVGIVQRLPA